MIFNNRARVYSTCRACRQIMVVLDADETVHPCCEPQPTKLESLAQGWLSAVLAEDDEAERLTSEELSSHDAQPPELRRYAVHYARIGWPVFPLRPVGTRCDGGQKCEELCQCPKTPLRGSRGFKDATTDAAVADAHWRKNPTHNIGLATGHLFDVIDVDVKSGGVQSFLKLLEQGQLPDIHGVAGTTSGGMHLYVQRTGRGIGAGFYPGIDHRGVGGYCVAPPSTLGPRERSYSWLTVPSPEIKTGTIE